MDIAEFSGVAARWGVVLSEDKVWEGSLLLFERICHAKRGYFVFKIDGEREKYRYTFVLNLPYPVEFVFRKDVDCFEDGLVAILRELSMVELQPGP